MRGAESRISSRLALPFSFGLYAERRTPATRKRVPRRRTFFLLILAIILCVTSVNAADWKQATGERTWSFPRDHGSHPEYRTEWWYFTGNLSDRGGNRYGYQLTFFRQGIEKTPKDPGNPWSIRDLYLAHFTITDVTGKGFWFAERISRAGPGLAFSDTKGLDVWLLNWSARMVKNVIRLSARREDMEIDLELVPKKPPVLHGQKGLSKKGPGEGQSSYYYSFTDLATTGTVRLPLSKQHVHVSGTSWFDQEFGSNQLSPDQAGWDWFSLHLSDGRDLMIYLLRKKDGATEQASSGTIVERDGTGRHLRFSDIAIDILGQWKSPKSSGTYPARWRIRVPSAQIDLTLSPLVADQELITGESTGITYWEGAAGGSGTSMGQNVTCEGYVELTGYAGTIGGTF
ncbi:MAG: Hydroxyneurosporene synthase (CrtC) [Syntrophorhabdus sp. PtaU1.Bin058]|nr:MAG: Hydroxyneurosporene synthase (CrtC) [Syntrophorhabdus sp. PtaU1.Bin058]